MTPNAPNTPSGPPPVSPPATPPPISPPSIPPPAPRKTRWLLYGCGTLVALLLVIVATVALTLWWIQRPIKPVVLSAPEKAAVEQKIRRLEGVEAPEPSSGTVSTTAPTPGRGAKTGASPAESTAGTDLYRGQDRPYLPGSKVLRLTEREINGLLNANTDLGKSVRLEFATDAINAYVAVPIPEDFPVGGGRMFRARSRFRVSLGNGGVPFAVLEDVTVFGISLPKAWLGGLKGENLFARAMGEGGGSPGIKGIKRLRVETGALVLELED